MRGALSLLSLLLLVFLAPTAAADAAPAETVPACVQTAADAQLGSAAGLAPDARAPKPTGGCGQVCPAQEHACFQNSDCSAVCPCGGRCVQPFLQVCVYERLPRELWPSHCECDL